MRKILFRGKRIDSGEWEYGGCVFTENKVCLIYNQTHSIDLQGCTVEENSVGQYTGLTDKNGKKIFEGDILHVKQCGEKGVGTCAIYFGEYIDADNDFEDYRCIGFYLKVVDECFSIGVLLDSDFEFEVIGNIHDNPDLLEVKE